MRSPAAGIETACGPRASEERLLAALLEDQHALATDLAPLARPLLVLVPSHSLRLAFLERMAARGSFLGVAVRTLHRFAEELHERAGVGFPRGERLLPILAHRLAAAHQELAALARGRDGLAALVAALRDLQHAGFTSAHAPAMEDCLNEFEGYPAARRARALIEIALRLEPQGVAAGAWARSAAQLVRDRPELVAARAVWIHGFQDAPGTTAELLEALVARAGARVVFDTLALALPAGPAGLRYGEALAQRLGVPRPQPCDSFTDATVELDFVEALGARAEARAIATAIRARIESGVRPERIAVVARTLERQAGVLAAALRGLGVPFSALAAEGSPGAASRAAHAFADVLEQGGRAHLVRALRAGWALGTQAPSAPELLAACGLLGATRLETLANLDLELALGSAEKIRLPGGHGRARAEEDLAEEEPEEGEAREELAEPEPDRDNRRCVESAAIARLRQRAREWISALDGLAQAEPFERHAAQLRALAAEHFPGLAGLLGEALARLGRELPAPFSLSPTEFLELAAEALRAEAQSPLGGAGAGVQVLDALEARSRGFDELFLADLRQGSFPRSVREEPILPDALRRRMRDVLPDLPVKSAALSEEEALFAGLLRSAPRATLSWMRRDDDGRAQAPSPFVRRVWRERRGSELATGLAPLASFAAPRAGDPARVEVAPTEFELLARLAATDSGAFEAGLAEVLAAEGCGAAAPELARHRLEVLAELEPAHGRPAYPNAFLGSVGPRSHPRDARRTEPHVSGLEALANCPWQMLLERVLGLAAPIPVRDLGAVLEPAHVGSVVHETLAALAREHGSAWPDEACVRALCAAQAQAVVRKERLAPAGLARVLALRAQGFLEVARRLDEGATTALRAEVDGGLRTGAHELQFRADRVAGSVWTDFKTSRRPVSEAKTEAKRAEHMLEAVRTGRALQGPAYAFASGADATGRYVYLHPRIDDALRVQGVGGADGELRGVFDDAVARLWSAWDEGGFPPRLVAPDLRREHKGCATCDFQAACQRGDSGLRARTVAWVRADEGAAGAAGFAGALQGLWRMKRPQPEAHP